MCVVFEANIPNPADWQIPPELVHDPIGQSDVQALTAKNQMK
jgi:hypothetical protein